MKRMICIALLLCACAGEDEQAMTGGQGPQGEQGAQGPAGSAGPPGAQGTPGTPAFASGTRLRAQQLVADDGSKMLHSWFDTKFNEPCEFKQRDDGKYRCMPIAPELRLCFNESSCTNAIAYFDLSCFKPNYAYIQTSECPVKHPKLVKIDYGSAHTSSIYCMNPDGTCTKKADSASWWELKQVDENTLVSAVIQ